MSVFDVQKRTEKLFKLHGTPAPEPGFGESETSYQRRVVNCAQALLPAGHDWAGVNLSKLGAAALNAIESHVVHGRVKELEAPVGPLRQVIETDPRVTGDASGRAAQIRFYGDPAETWAPFTMRQRVTMFAGKHEGRFEGASDRSERFRRERAEQIGLKAMAAGGK